MIYYITSLIFVLVIFFLIVRQVQRYQFMNKYKIVLDLFDYFLSQAYQVIYSDQLIAYTSMGSTGIPKDQLETHERNFIKLCLELMGPQNEQLLVDFFGGREIVIKNIVLYFRRALDSDVISKALRSRMGSNE